MHNDLADAILECFEPCDMFEREDGTRFQAITETDLRRKLRDRGWRLPGPAYFTEDVRKAGFTVKQGYEFSGDVRRVKSLGRKAPRVSRYQTLVFL